jgi:hypothetical protein
VLIGSKGSEISGALACGSSLDDDPGLLSAGALPFDFPAPGAVSSGFMFGVSALSDAASLGLVSAELVSAELVSAMLGAAAAESDATLPKSTPEDFCEISQALREKMSRSTGIDSKAFFIADRLVTKCIDGITFRLVVTRPYQALCKVF